MRPRFQADADFNHKIVRGVRRREPRVDFANAHEGGVVDVADPVVLSLAAAAGRILISHDRKTMPGHFADFVQERDSPGVIIVSQNLDISSAIDDILLIWTATVHDEWLNRIGVVPL